MTEEFLSMLGDGWRKELADLKTELADAARIIVEFHKNAKLGEMKLLDAKSVGEAVKASEALKKAQADLQQSAEKGIAKGEEYRAKQVAAQKAVTELSLATKEYAKLLDNKAALEAKAAAMTSQAAKEQAAAKVALMESSRALIEEAKAQDASFQARMSAAEQLRRQRAEEKAAAQERKEYAAWWKQALKEQEVAERAAAQAELQERAMVKELQNEYKQLSLAYRDASLKYKNYALTLGEAHPITVQAQQDAQKMDATLKRLDANVGQHQRNVGNYASAFSPLQNAINQLTREAPAFANSMQTGFMAISNNLPILSDAIKQIRAQNAALREEGKPTVSVLKQLASGFFSWGTALSLGITLLTVFGKDIVAYFSNLGKATKATDLLKESTLKFQASVRDGAAQELAASEISYRAATNVTLGYKARHQAAEDLKKQYPTIFANLSTEAIMAGKAASAYDKLKEAIIAKTAVSVLQKDLEEAIKLQLQIEDNAAEIDKNTERQKALQGSNRGMDLVLQGQAASATFAESAKRNIDSIYDRISKFQDILQTITKPDKEKKTKQPTDYTNELLSADQKAAELRAKILQNQIQESLEAQKTIYEDEKNGFSERLTAADAYNMERLNQLRVAKAGELNEAKIALAKIAEIEEKGGKPTKEEKGLLIKKEEYLLQVKEITERYTAEEEKATREGQQRITAVETSELEKRKRALTLHLAEKSEEITKQMNAELSALVNRHSKGIVSEESYRKEEALIREMYQLEELNQQLQLVDAEIANAKKLGADTTALEKEAAKIKEGIAKGQTKIELDQIAQVKAARKELQEQTVQLAKAVSDTIITFIDAGYQRQIDQLDKQKQGIQDNLEAELAAIEATTVAGTEREEKIAIAKANAAAKEKQIDAEREQIENRRKELNRLVQAAQITGTAIQTGVSLSAKAAEATAQAALLAANPLTAAYAPVAVAAAATISAQIPIVAGIAAAQIAALYAYKDGTDNHPEDSFAIVGDGYRKEVVQTPDGRTYLTPDRPTVTFMKEGTKVFPSVEDYMQRHQIQSMAGVVLIPMPSPQVNVDVSAIQKGLQKVEKAVRAQRPVILKGHDWRFDGYYKHVRK